jgi:hypothetical protein
VGTGVAACLAFAALAAPGPDGTSTFGQLIASWNGTAWSYPDVEVHRQGTLHAVDCVDPKQCVAVGEDFGKSFYRPLAFVGTSPAA